MIDIERKRLKVSKTDDNLKDREDDYFLIDQNKHNGCQFFTNVEPLKREEEYKLFERLKKGDESVIEKIVFHNLKYVYFMARNYTSDPYLLEELFQQGSYGLMKSLESFDYKKGFRFSTYASYSIRKYIIEFFQNYNLIRISRDDYIELNNLNKKISKLENSFHRTASLQEISEYSGYSIDKIREIKRRELTFISLEQYEKGDDNLSVIDYYYDSQSQSIHIDFASDIIKQLKDEKNQLILKLYLGIDDGIEYTFQQIGDILGISKQAVKKRYDKSIKEIKEMLKEDYEK
ncbi:MAG TPA: sigma-70 family RNA polymerase sigma factor [Erysipelotrichaceae bacterium]|nr:sigma-70 family RNA polymerase sigma factor [Erysipelotrichaceae bacterium]